MTDRHAETASPTGKEFKPHNYKGKSSADIEREIESTLLQIDGSLSAIEERLNLQRTVEPVRRFFASPPGKALLAAAMVSFARRKPVLAFALGATYLYYRKKSESSHLRQDLREAPAASQGKRSVLSSKPMEEENRNSLFQREQGALRGHQATMAIEAGTPTTEDGEYACRNCGHRTYLERAIIMPACPDCGGEIFDRENL